MLLAAPDAMTQAIPYDEGVQASADEARANDKAEAKAKPRASAR
jgi:hypothetical protein